MRATGFLLALALLLAPGCGLPEDLFVLQGSLVDWTGRPLGDTEVRLQRDASLDGIHCAPMVELARTRTDAEGRYRFELIRQQLSLGSPRRRSFRVEATDPSTQVSSFTFVFPSVDLTLPPLPVSSAPLPAEGWADVLEETDVTVDGVLAWRGAAIASVAAEGREARLLDVTRQLGTLQLVRDSFGGTEDLALQLRFERSRTSWANPGIAPDSRGVACSVGPESDPCPLTDGRFLPFRLPPDTRAIVLTFPNDRPVGALWFHGLSVEGDFSRVELEWSPTLTDAFKPYLSVAVDTRAVANSRLSCDEPGASLGPLAMSLGAVPRPQRLRMKFLDPSKKALPVQWLAEVSVSSAVPR
ncbi:MAG: hypothetical protein ACYC8T_05835 [Myxococcaceae bacterium]